MRIIHESVGTARLRCCKGRAAGESDTKAFNEFNPLTPLLNPPPGGEETEDAARSSFGLLSGVGMVGGLIAEERDVRGRIAESHIYERAQALMVARYAELEQAGQIVLRYAEDCNGSVGDVAGELDEVGQAAGVHGRHCP